MAGELWGAGFLRTCMFLISSMYKCLGIFSIAVVDLE